MRVDPLDVVFAPWWRAAAGLADVQVPGHDVTTSVPQPSLEEQTAAWMTQVERFPLLSSDWARAGAVTLRLLPSVLGMSARRALDWRDLTGQPELPWLRAVLLGLSL